MTMRCHFCGKEADNPILLCMNSRDMEERAIAGRPDCYDALARIGGGERGMERIDQIIKSNRLLDEMAAEGQAMGLYEADGHNPLIKDAADDA
jgi:transcriptional regulator NrdR family protein